MATVISSANHTASAIVGNLVKSEAERLIREGRFAAAGSVLIFAAKLQNQFDFPDKSTPADDVLHPAAT